MNNTDNHTLLARWLDRNLSSTEQNSLEEDFDLDSLQHNLDMIDYLDMPALDIEKQYQLLLNKKKIITENTSKNRKLFPIFMKIAAAILIMAVPSWIWYQSQGNIHISTAFAEHQSILLPDGSAVTLNADTELSYNKRKWDKERSLNLQGEAFFKVEKGTNFTVKTKEGNVKVLGTKFNVFARDDVFRVACYEGKVRVKSKTSEAILLKGNAIEIRLDKKERYEVIGDNEGWVIGNIKFNNTPLKEVFEAIERQYNIEIKSNGINEHRKFTGELPDDDLELGLKILAKTMGLKYIYDKKTGIVSIDSK